MLRSLSLSTAPFVLCSNRPNSFFRSIPIDGGTADLAPSSNRYTDPAPTFKLRPRRLPHTANRVRYSPLSLCTRHTTATPIISSRSSGRSSRTKLPHHLLDYIYIYLPSKAKKEGQRYAGNRKADISKSEAQSLDKAPSLPLTPLHGNALRLSKLPAWHILKFCRLLHAVPTSPKSKQINIFYLT